MFPGFPGRSVAVAIERVRGAGRSRIEDEVAAEEPLEIRVAQADGPVTGVCVTMRTPGHDFELAAGFLYTEGIVRAAADIVRIDYADDALPERHFNVVEVTLRDGCRLDAGRLARNFYISSSCGVCGKASLDAIYFQGCRPIPPNGFRVSGATLRALPDRLRRAQRVFAATGGLHAAGLFTADGELVTLREDVGRHNAVDKLIGERLLAGAVPLSDRILLLSGRASFELLQKAVVAGVPVVAAVGAPSSLAVDAAREYGLTLVGFLKADGFNIYAGAERVHPVD